MKHRFGCRFVPAFLVALAAWGTGAAQAAQQIAFGVGISMLEQFLVGLDSRLYVSAPFEQQRSKSMICEE